MQRLKHAGLWPERENQISHYRNYNVKKLRSADANQALYQDLFYINPYLEISGDWSVTSVTLTH